MPTLNLMRPVRLHHDDPTVFAKCEPCDPHRPGAKVGTYYGASFSESTWRRKKPRCPNCDGPLTVLRKIERE